MASIFFMPVQFIAYVDASVLKIKQTNLPTTLLYSAS